MAYIPLYNIPTFLKDPDLVAYYRFEDNVKNEAGTKEDVLSGVTFDDTDGVPGCGKFAHFTSGDFVTLDKSINLMNEGNITIMCWVKLVSGSTAYQCFINMGYDGYFVQTYLGTDPNGTGNKVLFGQYQADLDAWKFGEAGAVLSNNTWTHCVGTWDGATWKLYIGGVLQGTTGADARALRACSRAYTLGKSGAPWGDNFLVGDLDEVCILKRLLSATDIANIVAGTYTPPAFALAGTENKLKFPRRTRVPGIITGLE